MLSFQRLFFIFNWRSCTKIMAQQQQRKFRLDKMNSLFGPVFYNPSVDNVGQQEMLQGKTRNPRLSSYMVDNTRFIFLFTVIKFLSEKLFVCIFQKDQFFCLLVHLLQALSQHQETEDFYFLCKTVVTLDSMLSCHHKFLRPSKHLMKVIMYSDSNAIQLSHHVLEY